MATGSIEVTQMHRVSGNVAILRTSGIDVQIKTSRQVWLLAGLLMGLVLSAIAGCDSSANSSTLGSPRASRPRAARKPVVLSKIFDLRQSLEAETQRVSVKAPVFDDVASSVGLRHTYETGDRKLLLMVQPTGGGCGWIDYDRDGTVDLYLNQGGDPSLPPSATQPSDQLFRNMNDGQFRQVTELAGIDERDYGQGVTVGDFDNDGFSDIMVTNIGICTLYQNQGDGTFRDLSGAIQQSPGWHSSAAWGDIDRDGDLDLYVCRYVDFDRFHPRPCLSASGERRLCQPNEIEPRPDELYLNEGDETFRAVAQERGLFGPSNKALGVTIADFDNDEWPDIYVANDATPNFLFVNQRDGQFLNKAGEWGCAVASDGRAQASMGIAVGDYDHNGFLDLYLTHYEGEWNTLYRNLGPAGFSDVTAAAGGVSMTLPMVGFGTVMEDFNCDGFDDLVIANGHLDDPGHLGIELAMLPQLFSIGNSQVTDNSARGGGYFSQRSIGRGMATADYDGDGDLDLAIVHQNTPVSLLKNQSSRGHWLQLQFIGRRSNRQGIGVRVSLRSGSDYYMRELAGGTSYCASHEAAMVFGLGDRDQPCELAIVWPSGRHQSIRVTELDRIMVLSEPADDAL